MLQRNRPAAHVITTPNLRKRFIAVVASPDRREHVALFKLTENAAQLLGKPLHLKLARGVIAIGEFPPEQSPASKIAETLELLRNRLVPAQLPYLGNEHGRREELATPPNPN